MPKDPGCQSCEELSTACSISDALGQDLEATHHSEFVFEPMDGGGQSKSQGQGTKLTLARYPVLMKLGEGGMGEVYRVLDQELNRHLAMKVLKRKYVSHPEMVSRFVEEAQIMAQLDHPSIVPLFELGQLADGRLYFTMREIRGQTLRQVINEIHQASGDGPWKLATNGWRFRGLVEAFLRCCEAVAYAHSLGVIHRDLKPDNVMVGTFGEVLVMDWGLARILSQPTCEPQLRGSRSHQSALLTQVGRVAGTPAYMAPEQKRGSPRAHTPATDVYNLGAFLHHILVGHPPKTDELLPRPERVPEPLWNLYLECSALGADERPQGAQYLVNALQDYLQGAKKRQQALALIERCMHFQTEMMELRGLSDVLQGQADQVLSKLPFSAPTEQKIEGWTLEDKAVKLRREAQSLGLHYLQGLRSALSVVADLPEAHLRLAEHFYGEHLRAELQGQCEAASAAAFMLEHHDKGGVYREYLSGTGSLSVYLHSPGGRGQLFEYRVHERRLRSQLFGPGLNFPLQKLPLPMGSYCLRIDSPGHESVDVPFVIARGEDVSLGKESAPLKLPGQGALEGDDIFVSAGVFTMGGDEEAPSSLPKTQIFVPDFVIKKFPVTNQEYLNFLNDLVAQGRSEEALSHAPRERGGAQGTEGALIFTRGKKGQFGLGVDEDGEHWLMDQAVCMVDWSSAQAYACWYGERTAKPWRLPYETEWEKAARGVDGRYYPWGNFLDPNWCCVRSSFSGAPHSPGVDSYEVDQSPYGVRGMAGNVMDWCADIYKETLDIKHHFKARYPMECSEDIDVQRVLKGASWGSECRSARSASRVRFAGSFRYGILGFRLARSF